MGMASSLSGLRGDSRPFDKLRAGFRLSGGAMPGRALSAKLDETKTQASYARLDSRGRVQFHDILYTMFHDILYTPARA